MIKLVLTDLDDTLIAFGTGGASDRAIDAFHAAQAAGVHVGPVTGRQRFAMDWMFRGHPECYATGAYSNGQAIDIDGERVFERSISAEHLAKIAAYLDDFGDAYLAVYDLDDENDVAYVTTQVERLYAKHPPYLDAKISRVVSAPETDYLKANIHCTCPHERIVELRDGLVRYMPELDFVFPSALAPILDITPKGWTKGTAALWMADYLGIAHDEVAVFGDSENDLALIQTVPNSVAVANADPEVKAAARWHIGASADNAVADAIFDIAEATRSGEMPRFMR